MCYNYTIRNKRSIYGAAEKNILIISSEKEKSRTTGGDVDEVVTDEINSYPFAVNLSRDAVELLERHGTEKREIFDDCDWELIGVKIEKPLLEEDVMAVEKKTGDDLSVINQAFLNGERAVVAYWVP